MNELALILREKPGDEAGLLAIRTAIESLEQPGAFVFLLGEERSEKTNTCGLARAKATRSVSSTISRSMPATLPFARIARQQHEAFATRSPVR